MWIKIENGKIETSWSFQLSLNIKISTFGSIQQYMQPLKAFFEKNFAVKNKFNQVKDWFQDYETCEKKSLKPVFGQFLLGFWTIPKNRFFIDNIFLKQIASYKIENKSHVVNQFVKQNFIKSKKHRLIQRKKFGKSFQSFQKDRRNLVMEWPEASTWWLHKRYDATLLYYARD